MLYFILMLRNKLKIKLPILRFLMM